MDQEWSDSIEREGFAILESVFPAERMDRVLDDLDRLSPQRSRAGVRHAHLLSPVKEIAEDPLLTELARAVLGAHAIPFHTTLFDKSPSANWLVVWHQDTALPLCERNEVSGWGPWSIKEGVHYAHAPAGALSQVLALRVHLDDSTSNNGPLRILPRTHERGVLSDDRIHELAQGIPPVNCVCSKGGVVAMRPLAVHASSKSQSDNFRRVLHIEYASSEAIASPLRLAIPTA